MAKKKKVYDTSLIDGIRQRTAMYDNYIAPKANVDEYFHVMENPPYEGAPDDYGVIEHVANAYNNWLLNRNQVIKDSSLGDYVMAEDDSNTILGAKEYIQAVRLINTILPLLREDPNNEEVKQAMQQLSQVILTLKSAYEKILGDGLNDSSLNTRLKADLQQGNWDSALNEIDRLTTELVDDNTGSYKDPSTLYSRKSEALFKADIAANKAAEYDSKITSDYYKRKMVLPGMDFSDIDTYLFKLPGLLGSSAATLTEDILTTGGTWAAGALGSLGGPIGLGIGIAAGAAINIGGNIYSRDKESKGEVYSNYKQAVMNAADSSKVGEKVLKDAKASMIESGLYTEELINDDDFVYDLILTNKVPVKNVKFDKIRIKYLDGLKSLYTDNMALSASDIALTTLEVVPIGKIAKSVKGVKTLTEKTSRALTGVKKQIADRIDDVTAFGIENATKLPKITKRKAIRDLGGRILVSSLLEGSEEGVQYIKGQRYVDRDFEADPNIVKSWVNNVGTGARSIFAALTPFDPVYSDDKEFMENFKGGALLGGLTTSVVGGLTTYNDVRQLLPADKLLSAMYADKMYAKDRVRKNILYSEMARTNKWDNLMQSFDNLESANIDGVDIQEVKAEKERAKKLYNMMTSSDAIANAQAVGIDPRTEDYNIFVALRDHHDDLKQEAESNANVADSEVQNIMNSKEVDDYIMSILPKNKDVTEDQILTIKTLMQIKSGLEVNEKLTNDFLGYSDKLDALEKNTGIRTSKSDVIHFRHLLEDRRLPSLEFYKDALKQIEPLGIKEEQLLIPTLHQSLKDALERLEIANLDVTRAQIEADIMHSDNSKAIKAKINKWKEVEDAEDTFVLELDDMYSGKREKDIIIDSEEISPKVIDTTVPTLELLTIESDPVETPTEPIEPIALKSIETKLDDDANDIVVQRELKEAIDDFISSGEWVIAQRVQQKYGKDRLDEIRKYAEEERSNLAARQQEEIRQLLLTEQNTNEGLSSVNDNDGIPVAPILDVDDVTNDIEEQPSTTPQEVPALDEILGGWLGEEVQQGMLQTDQATQQQTVEPVETTIPQQSALTYDRIEDPYSHLLSYRLTKTHRDPETGVYVPRYPVKYQGMEKYMNNDDLAAVSANPDFVSEVTNNGARFVVTTYINPNKGNKPEPAIYAILNYKGNEYAAAVKTVDGLYARSNHAFLRLPFEQQLKIVSNLNDLRNKIIELDRVAKLNPNLQIVPTYLNTTTGSFINEKNEDGSPKNKVLTESYWLGTNDPYKVDPATTHIGVTTGALSNEVIRLLNEIVSSRGKALGKPAWVLKVPRRDGGTDTKIALLNYGTFKDSPRIADLIIDLVTTNALVYTDAVGTLTNISPKDLLSFLVNFGPHTAVNPNDTRLDSSQIQAKIAKQFYLDDNNNVVIGPNTYSISDIVSNENIRDLIQLYIVDNFHYNIDEQGLTTYWLGDDFTSKNADPHFKSVKAFLKNSDVDEIILVPGEIEFSLKDFGLKREGDKKIKDPDQPRGISTLGWYIKQGAILTDIADNLWDANIYIDDVMLVDKSIQSNDLALTIEQPMQQVSSGTVFTITDESGNKTTIDLEELLGAVSTDKRKGPNMNVATSDSFTTTMDVEQAKQYLIDTVGITPEILDSVIEATEAGNSVVGRVTEDSILLYENAPQGTEYHEAWHRISYLLIDPKRRNKIYNRYRSKHPELTDSLIDEMLAEDFRQFMLDESGKYAFDTRNWFRRILDFIKLWARTGQYALARLYSDINRGKFAGVTPSKDNVERFRLMYGESGPDLEVAGYPFKTITQYKQFDDIVKSLTYAFFRTSFENGNLIDYADLANEKPRFDTLKLIVEAQSKKYPSAVMDEVVDKFDSVFAPAIASRLKQLGIRAIDSNENDYITDIEEGAEGVNIGQHTVEGINISIKDNAPAEVKFFFLTIPALNVTATGSFSTKLDPVTHFPLFVDSNSAWNHVLKDLAGCRTIKNIISKVGTYAANNDPFYSALLFRLLKLVKDCSSTDNKVATNAEAMLTKIETVLTSDINSYITVKVDKDPDTGFTKLSLKDNTVDVKAMTYPKVWSLSLFTNSGIFKYSNDGTVLAEDGARYRLNTIINNLNTIRTAFTNNKGILKLDNRSIDLHDTTNQSALKDFIVRQLNAVGIQIDTSTINLMLMSGVYGSSRNSGYELINKFVVSTANFGGLSKVVSVLTAVKDAITNDGRVTEIRINDKVTQPQYIWNEVGFIKQLANYYAFTHATDNSLSSYGPDGNTYYMVSQNNFAKDRLYEIVNDKDTFDNLSAVVYNGHSIILNSVRSGNKGIQIETLINFKDATSNDAGRDYFGITDREDYLAKMAAVFSDRIVFPTVADKKTYHFIKGVTLPHERLLFVSGYNGTQVVYGENSMDILLGYCQDELNQIELTLRQIDDDPSHYDLNTGLHYNEDGSINRDWLEPNRRIKNFHTPNKYTYKDNKGVKRTVELEGNGARFLFLTGIYTDKGFVSFNDPTKSAKENLQTAKDYFFNTSADTLKAFLSSVLNERVRLEIQTAKDLGIISINDNNDLWSIRSILLDDEQVNSRKAAYMLLDPSNAEAYAVFDMLADYTINSIISISEIEKLFSGSPAYYKVKYDKNGIVDLSIDKIKRLGSLTSTGLNNRLDFFNRPIRDEYTVAELKDHEIMDKQYYEFERLFTLGNLKDAIIQLKGINAWNESKDLSMKELLDKFPDAAKIANAKAKIEVAGYKSGINVADAAVYISPEMTRDLLRMRGVWSADIERAFDVLTNPETADKWESDPTLYAEANKVILNAMKYVAFGTRFNEIPGLGIPYFNKMALFPLFKSIATGDIKALYDRMTDSTNPLDMVLFDSAVKAGSRSPMKAYRSAKDSEIELRDGQTVLSAEITDLLTSGQGNTLNDFNNLVTYKLKFKYIRQQLETNPHTHEEQMAGTQFLKVNLSNLRMEDVYGQGDSKLTGEQIKDTVMSALNKLSDMGKSTLQSELFTKDSLVNIPKLAKMLEKDARESDANDNILSGLRTKDGSFIIPLSALSDNKWLESRFISMINKQIIDVHMPGGAFIQRSAFGIEATSQTVVTEKMINNGKPLLMINEKDGSMDSIVSINLLKHIIPGYNKMTFELARQWLIDKNIIGLNTTANAIGYRIPTQSIASISALRFVDVYPEIMGDTIVLPEGFTKLTGSDFDIDKLYVARYAYNNKGGIIKHGDALKYNDVQSAYKNDILNAYLHVLLTKENTNQLKLSIDNDTENVKAILEDIESNRQVHYAQPFEVYTPTYLEARKAEYTGGKAGIGPFALNNAHHILTQLVKLRMLSNDFTEALNITELGRIYDYPTAGKAQGERILGWLSAMINAFVDIAKDPYIVRLNVNSWTYNMVSFLLRTGKGALTFYFIGQPILKEMAAEILKTKGKYGIDRTKTPSLLEREAIETILDKYDPDKRIRRKYEYVNRKDDTKAKEYSDLFATVIKDGKETSRTRELLLNDYNNPTSKYYNPQLFKEEQVRIYYAWLALKPYADDLANLVKYSKIDTKKTGKSFAEQLNYYNGMMDMIDNSRFADGEVERFYKETFIWLKTENSIPFGSSIFRNLLLRNTDAFTNQKDIVLSLLGRKNNADVKLLSAVISGMEAQIKTEFFNAYILDNNIDFKEMFVGNNSVPNRLNRFKQEILKGNPKLLHLRNADGTIANDFVNYLIPNLNKDGIDFIDRSEQLSPDQALANNLINYWRQLLDDPNPQVKRLFRDVAIYSFYTSGDNGVMNSFFQYLPNSFKKEIGYTDFIQSKLDLMVLDVTYTYDDKEDMFLNNWKNDKLVRPVDFSTPRGNLKAIYTNSESTVPNIILGQMMGKDTVAIHPIGYVNIVDMGKYPIFPPYVKTMLGSGFDNSNWHVYRLIGYTEKPEYNGDGKLTGRTVYTPAYGLVSKKGYSYRGHTIVEYGRNTAFDFNRESEWNYYEALQSPEALLDMIPTGELDFWYQDVISPINTLPSYYGMNYALNEQDRVFEESQEDVDESEVGVVLKEADEPGVSAKEVIDLEERYGVPEEYRSDGKLPEGEFPDFATKLVEVDIMALWDSGYKRVETILNELELTQEERQLYLNEFTQIMRDSNVNTQDSLEEAIRKFICNL